MHLHNVQPVKQIFAKFAFAHELREIAIGRTNDTHIHVHSVVAAQPLEASLLQNAKQLGLKAQSQIANLVQKQRGVIRGFDATAPHGEGSSKSPLFMSEELVFNERFGQVGARERYHWASVPGTQLVDRTRQKLLAGARFARYQYVDVAGSDLLRKSEEFLHGRGRAQQLIESALTLSACSQPTGFLDGRLKKVRAPQNQAELHHIRRVRYGVVSTSLNRGQNNVAILLITESDQWRSGGCTSNVVDQAESTFVIALGAGRPQIKHGDVRPKINKMLGMEFTAAFDTEGGSESPCQRFNETEVLR